MAKIDELINRLEVVDKASKRLRKTGKVTKIGANPFEIRIPKLPEKPPMEQVQQVLANPPVETIEGLLGLAPSPVVPPHVVTAVPVPTQGHPTLVEEPTLLSQEPLVTEGPKTHILVFKSTLAASGKDSITRRVPWDGYITEVSMDFSATANNVDMRLVHIRNGTRDYIVPSIEAYISQHSGQLRIRDVHYKVEEDDQLTFEMVNNSTTTAYTVSAVVVIARKDQHVEV